jgi:hypothetical protein
MTEKDSFLQNEPKCRKPQEVQNESPMEVLLNLTRGETNPLWHPSRAANHDCISIAGGTAAR